MSIITIPVGLRVVQTKASKMVMAFGFALLTALAAQIEFLLPFTPVPITLQTFAVIASGLFLGANYGLLAMAMYSTMGLSGLPVFAGGAAGPGVFIGPTGGYLAGLMLCSYVLGFLYNQNWLKTRNDMFWHQFSIWRAQYRSFYRG